MKPFYDHSDDTISLEGSSAALPLIFSGQLPGGILDVGCGRGAWLASAARLGCTDFLGVDGIDIPADQLLFSREHFHCLDLTSDWDLKRRFDAVLCLEVAEHLDESHADHLLDALVRHADTVIFSAACPGQPGIHHVNCRWPIYWQQKFNQRGYVCEDEVRWKIWEIPSIDWWYRQNLFIARRSPAEAGQEPRLRSIVRPEMIQMFMEQGDFTDHIDMIERGYMRPGWYITVPARALFHKIRRRFAALSSPQK